MLFFLIDRIRNRPASLIGFLHSSFEENYFLRAGGDILGFGSWERDDCTCLKPPLETASKTRKNRTIDGASALVEDIDALKKSFACAQSFPLVGKHMYKKLNCRKCNCLMFFLKKNPRRRLFGIVPYSIDVTLSEYIRSALLDILVLMNVLANGQEASIHILTVGEGSATCSRPFKQSSLSSCKIETTQNVGNSLSPTIPPSLLYASI